MVTNVTKNEVSVSGFTNDVFSAKNLTWAEADFTWGEGAGTWDLPYKLANIGKNTSTITNQAKT